ncbi:MAG: hypothetical protein QF466_08630 [Desulfobacterales bacterium]|nr:hypothetical protein [Desulfobacterales bacterium]
MVVEHFKEGKARKIYRRAEESGRMLPNGLRYIDSWVSTRLSMSEEKYIEHIATLSEDIKEVLKEKEAIKLKDGGIRVDPVFMTRQICDIVPNPWMAHEFAQDPSPDDPGQNRTISSLDEKYPVA